MLRTERTCARARILTSRRKTNCRSLSIILLLASLTFRRANTCSESEHAGPSSGKRRFESRSHQNSAPIGLRAFDRCLYREPYVHFEPNFHVTV